VILGELSERCSVKKYGRPRKGVPRAQEEATAHGEEEVPDLLRFLGFSSDFLDPNGAGVAAITCGGSILG